MILRPDFYRPLNVDRRAELEKLQFDPDRPTGIVMFGGHGSKVMRRIAKHLEDTQLILICGHNSELADRLRATRAKAPRAVVGFSSQIPYFMRLGDFFIGKPGPGSISEAIHLGLRSSSCETRGPCLRTLQRRLDPRTRRRMVLDSFSGIRSAVTTLTSQLDRYRSNIARISNRAIFEIPDILDRILCISGAGPDTRLFHPAFPGHPAPASDPRSNRAAAVRIGTAPPPNSVPDSAEPPPAQRRHLA